MTRADDAQSVSGLVQLTKTINWLGDHAGPYRRSMVDAFAERGFNAAELAVLIDHASPTLSASLKSPGADVARVLVHGFWDPVLKACMSVQGFSEILADHPGADAYWQKLEDAAVRLLSVLEITSRNYQLILGLPVPALPHHPVEAASGLREAFRPFSNPINECHFLLQMLQIDAPDGIYFHLSKLSGTNIVHVQDEVRQMIAFKTPQARQILSGHEILRPIDPQLWANAQGEPGALPFPGPGTVFPQDQKPTRAIG